MKEVIFKTVIITLAGVGFSTLICYIWDKCREFRRFNNELNVFIQSRKQGKRVIEIKVAKSALIPKTEIEPVPIEPAREVEQIQQPKPLREDPPKEKPPKVTEPQPQAPAPAPKVGKEVNSEGDEEMESLFVALEFEGEDYTSSHTVSADDLGHLAQVLGSDNTTVRDEARAVNTMLRLKDSPMMEQISNVTEKRVKRLVTSAVNNAPKIKKEGYDYSQYIN